MFIQYQTFEIYSESIYVKINYLILRKSEDFTNPIKSIKIVILNKIISLKMRFFSI
jgi:hypothetical protein